MLKHSGRITSLLLVTLALGACQDPATAPRRGPLTSASIGAGTGVLTAHDLATSLPAGVTILDNQTNLADRVINPGDYVCSNVTPVTSWLNQKISATLSVEPGRLFEALDDLADLMPEYEAIFYQTPATTQYFGYHGEHTKDVGKAERQLKGFWDISSAPGIQVVAMHGSMLIDTARTSAMYRSPYFTGLSAPVASYYADTLRRTLVNSQTMTDGNYPYFTFNSVSIGGVPGLFANKIVMGDGIMAVYDDLGFGDVAPQAILAHEYGHQVQFNKGYHLANPGSAAEATRFTELNADAMSAYFLTHKRGAALNQKRVEQFLQVFYDIGDCAFSDPGHHGTPNQRMAAAEFGFQLAHDAQKQGHILTPDEFQAAFVAAYPTLIAPDAP
jgi:hypothetical protein